SGGDSFEVGADEGSPTEAVAARLRWQAAACGLIGSPLYHLLLERAAGDVQAGGPAWEVLKGHHADPRGSMLGLRLMGAVHRLVLEGAAPELARFYASVGGDEPSERGASEAFLDSLER